MNLDERVTPYSLLSYPRAGSHYLQNLLLARFGVVADRNHWHDQIKKKDRVVISIIRNPVDSVASSMARIHHFGDNPGTIESSIVLYMDSLEEVLEKADIIISFDELVSDPDLVANKLSDILGLRLFDNGHDIIVGKGSTTNDFIPTSKKVDGYEDILKAVSIHPSTARAIKQYEAALSKCI